MVPPATTEGLATLAAMTSTDLAARRADAVRNRGAILEAAVDVLALDPAASLAEVATRAGLTRATLYRHFPSRDVLLAAIRDEALSRAATALDTAHLEDCSVRDGIHRAASALIPLGMRFRILLAEGVDTDPKFLAARDRTLKPLALLVARGVTQGELDPSADPVWISMVLAGLLTAAVRASAAGVGDQDEAADLVVRALFDGFGHR